MMKNSKRILAGALLTTVVVTGCGAQQNTNTPAPAQQGEQTTAVNAAETKTYENLQAALKGETGARAKYLEFAKKAGEEGNTSTQRLFTAAADAENIHIGKEYEVANSIKSLEKPTAEPVEVKTTAENLQAGFDGESYESNEMYKTFVEEAKADGNTAAEQIFTYARDAEASHAKLFEADKKLVEAGKSDDTEVYYLCPICGKIEKGTQPESCSICGAAGSTFVQY